MHFSPTRYLAQNCHYFTQGRPSKSVSLQPNASYFHFLCQVTVRWSLELPFRLTLSNFFPMTQFPSADFSFLSIHCPLPGFVNGLWFYWCLTSILSLHFTLLLLHSFQHVMRSLVGQNNSSITHSNFCSPCSPFLKRLFHSFLLRQAMSILQG